MSIVTMNAPRRVPTPKDWICNGSLNPLIRSAEQLRGIVTDADDYLKAVWYCNIGLQRTENIDDLKAMSAGELDALANAFFAKRGEPEQSREIMPGIRSVPQIIAKNQNMDCRALCRNLADLKRCFELLGGYNELSAAIAVPAFERFNRAQYFGESNCNTGRDAFKYLFGFEGSPVVYIEAIFYHGLRVLSDDWTTEQDLTREDFGDSCESLAVTSLADESSLHESSENHVCWRLWWD